MKLIEVEFLKDAALHGYSAKAGESGLIYECDYDSLLAIGIIKPLEIKSVETKTVGKDWFLKFENWKNETSTATGELWKI